MDAALSAPAWCPVGRSDFGESSMPASSDWEVQTSKGNQRSGVPIQAFVV
jgi:hypothetical protein